MECLGRLYCAVLWASGRTHGGYFGAGAHLPLTQDNSSYLSSSSYISSVSPCPGPIKEQRSRPAIWTLWVVHGHRCQGCQGKAMTLTEQAGDLWGVASAAQERPGIPWVLFWLLMQLNFAGRAGADRVVSGAPFLSCHEGLSGFPRAWACSHLCLGPCSQLFSLWADCSANTNTRSRRKAAFAEV